MGRLDPPKSIKVIGPQIQVASRDYINIPTAKTPMMTSAIHVSSLLFSANQSAIDEDAAPLSLVLSPCMTGLLQQLAQGPPGAADRRGLQILRPSFWSR
jgi:hypothetical protein